MAWTPRYSEGKGRGSAGLAGPGIWRVGMASVLISLLLLPAAGADAPPVVEFDGGANFTGDLNIRSRAGLWLALEGGGLEGSHVKWAETAYRLSADYSGFRMEDVGFVEFPPAFAREGLGARDVGLVPGSVTFSPVASSRSWIFLEADEIAIEANASRAWAWRGDAGGSMKGFEEMGRWAVPVGMPDESANVIIGDAHSPQSIRVRASGLVAVRWLGIHVDCAAGPCGPTGGLETSNQSSPAGAEVWTGHHEEWSVAVQGGTLEGVAMVRGWAFSSPSPVLRLDGTIRLPLASGATQCATCVMPANQTLTATGNMTLSNLKPSSQGRMSAEVGGDLATLRYDETYVPVAWLGISADAAATVGAVTLIGLLGTVAGKLIMGLWRVENPLDHPRRQALLDYVKNHPGATFREVVRANGLAAGTARHHLNVLSRGKLIVEHRHHGTLRLFENHGKFDTTWSDVVLLREPELKLVHDFVKASPELPQRRILDHFQEMGWSRSTTQHRLGRLVEGGVLKVRLQGRWKFYSVPGGEVRVVRDAVEARSDGLPAWAVAKLRPADAVAK